MKTEFDPGAGERGRVSWLARVAERVRKLFPSRRARVEQALRESEATFAAFMKYLPGWAFIKDEQRRCLYLNRSPHKIPWQGRTSEELLGAPVSEQSKRDDERVLAQREVIIADETVLLNGETRILQATKFPIFLAADRVVIGGVAFDITERKRVEEALRKSEASLAHAQAMAKLGSWVHDCAANAGEWSAGMFQLMGRDPALGTPTFPEFVQSLHPDDHATFMETHQRFLREGSRVAHEYRIIRPDGAVRWIAAHAEPILDAAGRPLKLVGTSQDITERVEAGAALRESEEYYRLLFGQSPLPMWVYELETLRFLSVNDTAVRHYGYTEAEFLAMTLRKLSPSEDVAGQEQEASGPDLAGGPRLWWQRKKNGDRIAVEPSEKTISFRGRPARLCLLQDVTERKEAAVRLAEQAALIDQARDAIYVSDLDHRVVFWSKGAERTYGWTAAEALGRDINTLMQPDPGTFLEALEIVLREGAWSGEVHKVTKTGERLTLESRWTLLRDARQRPKSILTIGTDITERKRLEEQFLRAQRMESIGTLAGGIAHDLNNVLGPIIMSLDLLKMNFPDPASLELLDIIRVSAQRGADMVRQVLSFARGVEGRRMEVQVKHLVHDLEKIAHDTFLKHIQVRTVLPPGLWTVLGDPTQLHQVLLNLCVNARDAMPEGGVLTLSAENFTLDAQYAGLNLEARPGPYVLLQVQDTGGGMAPEVIDKIFDPFFTTKEVGKGTGLGLSTSLAIVKGHGGFFQISSEPGQGSKFLIYLPAQVAPASLEVAEIPAEMPLGHGEWILVVDDEPAVRQITQQTLEAFGYRVLLAPDGAEAAAVYATRGQEIAVVLTDMMMPVMDGPATIQVLRRMNPGVRIIGASGLHARSQLAQAASLGVKHFLPKPYTAETLLRTLQEVLAEP